MTHDYLVRRAIKWLRGTMRCGVVLAEVSGSGYEQPDAIGWKRGGLLSILVECKATREDFFRDFDKWHRRHGLSMGQTKFYFTPEGLVTLDEVHPDWGLVEAGRTRTKIIKRVELTSYDPDIWRREIPLLFSALRKVELGLPMDRFHKTPKQPGAE